MEDLLMLCQDTYDHTAGAEETFDLINETFQTRHLNAVYDVLTQLWNGMLTPWQGYDELGKLL